MTTYNLKVNNKSGQNQNIAVYQKLPGADTVSLVWFSKYIANGNTDQFSWDINWGLGWGTTSAPLANGVSYQSKGPIQPVQPFPTQTNGIKIGWTTAPSTGNGDFTQSPLKLTDLGTGQLKINTDPSFSVANAANMAVGVYVDGKPAFAMQGKPNGNYIFDTHPEYYIAVTDAKESTAISGHLMTNPILVEFSGTNTMFCAITATLTGVCAASQAGLDQLTA